MKNTLADIFIVSLLILIPFFVIWTDNNIEYLIHSITGKDINFPMFLSVLIASFFNGATLVFNIIVEVIKAIGV